MAANDLKNAVETALEGVRSLKNDQDELTKGVVASLNAVNELDQRETDTRQAAFTALDAAKALDSREKETRQFTEVALEATKELKDVSDSHRVQLVDHEMRIGALEQQETQPAPSSTAQPATTAAPAATPELRTDDIPDLPDPVVRVVEGGIMVDRVKRIWLNINQLQENKCDLDATNEPSTPTPIRQASIPQRRPEPLHRTPTRAEIEEEDRRQREAREDRRNQEESRRLPNRFDSDDPFSEPYDEIKPSHQDLVQTPQSRSDFPTLVQRPAEQKEKPEKKTDGKNNLIPIVVGAIIFLIAIATIIWASSRSSAPIQTTTTTIPVERTSNVVFQLPQGTALNLSAK